MRLNGWKSAWLVLSGLWVIALVVDFGGEVFSGFGRQSGALSEFFSGLTLIGFLFLVLIPPALLYLAGLVIAWLIHGFRSDERELAPEQEENLKRHLPHQTGIQNTEGQPATRVAKGCGAVALLILGAIVALMVLFRTFLKTIFGGL